jgi:3-oxoacyl-[acyl-carrier-protein] synthase-3
VPLTIVSELKERLIGNRVVLLSAFGVGMTWASAVVNFNNCKISDIVEI